MCVCVRECECVYRQTSEKDEFRDSRRSYPLRERPHAVALAATSTPDRPASVMSTVKFVSDCLYLRTAAGGMGRGTHTMGPAWGVSKCEAHLAPADVNHGECVNRMRVRMGPAARVACRGQRARARGVLTGKTRSDARPSPEAVWAHCTPARLCPQRGRRP